jgi:hypothetical protein
VSEEHEDEALLAWLRDGRQENDEQDLDAGLLALLQQGVEDAATDLDSELREFGLSPSERRKVLRQANRVPRDTSRYRTTVFRQFRWWIDKRIDWSTTDLGRDYVAATWMSLTKNNLDLAKGWWDAGINPLDLEQITALSEHGIHPRDLVVRIGKRTILEHVRRGTSVEWCVNALNWTHRRNAGA